MGQLHTLIQLIMRKLLFLLQVENANYSGNVIGQCAGMHLELTMRWLKDLIDSVALSSKINKQIGSRPPEGFNYELFLDQNGEKIL